MRETGPGPAGWPVKSSLAALPRLEIVLLFPAHGAWLSPVLRANAITNNFETASSNEAARQSTKQPHVRERHMKLATLQTLIIADILSVLYSANAAAERGIEIRFLTCNAVPGLRVNSLIRSTADVECVFENNGVTKEYHGETGIALGLDLSIRSNEKMAFIVIAAALDIGPGAKALGGKYVGGQVSATAGLGAKALIGGGAKM